MKGNFCRLLKKFCLEGSVLGLKYFYLYPDRVSRAFWAVTMVLTFFGAFLLTNLLYKRFEEMPTRITIENQYSAHNNLPYPTITICSPNQITISSMKHFNKTLVNGNLSLDLNNIIPQVMGFYELLGHTDERGLQHLQQLIDQNRYTALDVVSLLPQRCNQFLKLCLLQQKSYPCDGLFDTILTTSGLCCTFNSIYNFKKNKRNERSFNLSKYKGMTVGLENSLIVITDYNPQDAVDGTVLHAGAIKVMMTDWTEFPTDTESSYVYPGVESFHLIQATYSYCSDDVTQLPAWSRRCYFTDEYKLPYFKKYHRSDCALLCYTREVERRCQCIMPFIPHLNVHRACNVTSLGCIKNVRLKMNRDQCDCPRDCESRHYNVDMIIGNLGALPHQVPETYRGIVFNKSTSVMHFLFPSSLYVKQKQETVISLITLSSNIGGVFGLCLGCSVISAIEILFYIYTAIKNYLCRCRLKITQNKQRGRIGYYE